MTITSPLHSFVDFENRIAGIALPVVDPYVVAFQFLIERGTASWSDSLQVMLVSADKSAVLTTLPVNVGVINEGCSWATFVGIAAEGDFPVTVSDNKLIAPGVYETYDDFKEAFFNSGMLLGDDPFLFCCVHAANSYHVPYSTVQGDAHVLTMNLTPGVKYISFQRQPSDILNLSLPLGTCYRYAIKNSTQNQIIYSNVFQRKGTDERVLLAQYSNNENAFGFCYGGNMDNIVYLPIQVRNPQYPEKRKVYKKSSGSYKLLSATIEKEYEFITDYLPDEIHDRITVMLAHDNIFLSGRNISNAVTKREGDYTIDWQDVIWRDQLPVATAKTKIAIAFAGRNSNCEQRPGCVAGLGEDNGGGNCVPVNIPDSYQLPQATSGQLYNITIPVNGTSPFTMSNKQSPSWVTTFEVNQAQDGVSVIGTPPTAGNFQISFNIGGCNGSTDGITKQGTIVASGGGGGNEEFIAESLAYGNGTLTALWDGGTSPYHYQFSVDSSGTACAGYNVTSGSLSGTTNNLSASVGISLLQHAGDHYVLKCTVTDSAGHTLSVDDFEPVIEDITCLVPGTLITKANGTDVRLSEIEVGDLLSDFDKEKNTVRITKVLAKEILKARGTITINGGLLESSFGHQHIVKAGRGTMLKNAEAITVADKLFDFAGDEIAVSSVLMQKEEKEVINITTSSGTFIANGILTHNKLSC